jgi:hypothetical protein
LPWACMLCLHLAMKWFHRLTETTEKSRILKYILKNWTRFSKYKFVLFKEVIFTVWFKNKNLNLKQCDPEIYFILALFLICILQANLESRHYSKDQFSHAYPSVTIEQFQVAFGVSLLVLNHIKTVFTHLFTNFIRHIMTSKFKQTSDSVLILDGAFCSQ